MSQTTQQKRIVISGGGTGGHIFPAVAIANELRNPNRNTISLPNEIKKGSIIIFNRKEHEAGAENTKIFFTDQYEM
jgi:UDP-N-acetylglucosamine:LPS N-acetylglucosamine transferase